MLFALSNVSDDWRNVDNAMTGATNGGVVTLVVNRRGSNVAT